MLNWLKEKFKSGPPEMLENDWYKIVKFDNASYGVKRKTGVCYIDLTHTEFAWPRGDEYFGYCQGHYSTAKYVFTKKSAGMKRRHAKEIE
jgi:hypothetical protein